MLGNHIAGVVGRGQKHTIQQVLQGHFLPCGEPDRGAVRVQTGEGFGTGGDHVGQVALFDGQNRGHDLGQTGGIENLVRVLLIDRLPGVQVQKQRGLGVPADTETASEPSRANTSRMQRIRFN